jgi:hypothetical protein
MFQTTSGIVSFAAPVAPCLFATPTQRSIPLSTFAASAHQPSASSAFVAAHCHKRVVVAPVHLAAAMPANPFAASSEREHTLATAAQMAVAAVPAFATTHVSRRDVFEPVSRRDVFEPANHAAILINNPCAAPHESHTVTTSVLPSVATTHERKAALASSCAPPPCAQPCSTIFNDLRMPNNATMQSSAVRGGTEDSAFVTSLRPWSSTPPLAVPSH